MWVQAVWLQIPSSSRLNSVPSCRRNENVVRQEKEEERNAVLPTTKLLPQNLVAQETAGPLESESWLASAAPTRATPSWPCPCPHLPDGFDGSCQQPAQCPCANVQGPGGSLRLGLSVEVRGTPGPECRLVSVCHLKRWKQLLAAATLFPAPGGPPWQPPPHWHALGPLPPSRGLIFCYSHKVLFSADGRLTPQIPQPSAQEILGAWENF